MSDHREFMELMGAGVLDLLSPSEQRALNAHLAGCEVCAVEYQRLVELPGLLDIAGAVDIPRPRQALEESVRAVGAVLGGVFDDGYSSLSYPLEAEAQAGASGRVTVIPDEAGDRVLVKVAGLEPTGGTNRYEMWFYDESRWESVGTFRVGEMGAAEVTFTTAASPRELPNMAVTLEPDASDPRPSGNNALQGSVNWQ
jgi:hypothetical protein